MTSDELRKRYEAISRELEREFPDADASAEAGSIADEAIAYAAALEAEVARLRQDAEIVAVVFRFIDRMNDPEPEIDSAERILSEFTTAVMPLVRAHIDQARTGQHDTE